ncbi:hypothetical protein BFC18_08285 [Alteromonas confluentis]|uniref:Uncharacterized protein n=1 Tax=Alteromonas confluentis TaxID=1656094 RepID=A0A1E7ZD61_9ALTE|nr:hypothetical protein BFC18_08285 [Alteromonas confluentis]
MNKQQFLSEPGVRSFIGWFISKMDAGFEHTYCLIPKGKKPVTELWSCTSIFNAFEQYHWPFSYKNLMGDREDTISG